MSQKEHRTDPSSLLRLVVSAIEPGNGEDSPLWDVDGCEERLLASVLAYARRNGLEYFFLERWESLGLVSNTENRRQLRLHRQRISQIAKTIAMLNGISERSDLDYVIIKMPCMIPHVPRDIDIFVPDHMREEVIGSLISRGMRSEHSSSAETSLAGEGYAKVDVYSKICYFGFEFLDDDFFRTSTAHEHLFEIRCPVLEKTAGFTVELLHSLFGHRSMTLLDYLNMRLLMESVDNVESSRGIALKYGWGGVFDRAMENLSTIQDKIHDSDEALIFPFLFDREFILDCVSTIDGLCLSRRQRSLIKVSLVLDELIAQSKDSGLYEVLRANSLTRGVANSIAHSVRILRGDRKTA